MKIYALLGALLLLQGCVPKTLPPWEGEPLTVQFSARVVPQAAELPLQGGLRISAEGGTLGVILQHGRTLGECRIEPQPPGTADAPGAQTLRLHCRAAEGLGTSSQQLLARVALAACRTLHSLRTQGSPGAQPEGWRVTPVTGKALQPLAYQDSLGTVHITFSEVRP